jgi:hypothetical protein
MLKAHRIVLAIFESTSVLTALVFVALVALVLGAGALAARQAAAPGPAERTLRAAGTTSFAAFLAGMACTALSIWYLLRQHDTLYVAVVVTFIVQLALLTLAAVQVFIQMITTGRLRSRARDGESARAPR